MMKLTTKHFTRNLNLFNTIKMEYLQCRRWYRKLCLFYKTFKENKPVYLFNLIPSKNSNYNTRNTDKITPFYTKHNFFKKFLSIHCY